MNELLGNKKYSSTKESLGTGDYPTPSQVFQNNEHKHDFSYNFKKQYYQTHLTWEEKIIHAIPLPYELKKPGLKDLTVISSNNQDC